MDRSRRAPVPARRLADGTNGEAPSAAHEKMLAAKPIRDLIKRIETSTERLPTTISEALRGGEIQRVLTEVEGPDGDVASTFNRRFDILYGEDCRDGQGRLANVQRGDFRLRLVVQYLKSIAWESGAVLIDIASVKLERLAKELDLLCPSNPVPATKPVTSKASASEASQAAASSGGDITKFFTPTPKESSSSASTAKAKEAATDIDEEDEGDEDYEDKRRRALSEEEEDDNLSEASEAPEGAREKSRKRKAIVIDGKRADKPKKRKKKKATEKVPDVEVIEVESSDEEDMRRQKTGARGPKNRSCQHFRDPIAVVIGGKWRWEFPCLHCPSSVSFARTVPKTKKFEDEPQQPNIGNLANHMRKHGGLNAPVPQDPARREIRGLLASLEEAEDPDWGADTYSDNKEMPVHYDPETDEELRAMESEETVDANRDEEDFEAPILEARSSELASLSTIKKFRLICIKICSSPQRRARFRKIAADKYGDEDHILADGTVGRKIASLMPICEVKHRWNYMQASIACAEVLEKMTLGYGSMGYTLLLTPDQWKLLKALGKVLEEFTQVTLQMSQAGTPTLPWVLPLYEDMLDHLKQCRDDLKLPFQIRTGTAAALGKLEHYYELAQKSQFNVVSTLLHPALGISHFVKMDAKYPSPSPTASETASSSTSTQRVEGALQG
ncbi:hypothetical protein HMN09_00787000 [Mycena chlorophos]|uniref:Uncharacterized protein n=1 Tax=Mycena chlorophos TaxID=658473 RepID=A0A8H6SVC8_MYCCL|nr:hypothetical protein HMN09_00787000 [Mycena chlorophos]